MRINNFQFLPSTSGATSFNSLGYALPQVFGCAIQAVITGTLVGSAKLQVSVDPNTLSDPTSQPTNWTDYVGSAQTVSSAGTLVWNISDVWFNWVRIVYTATSGTGNISANINTKGI